MIRVRAAISEGVVLLEDPEANLNIAGLDKVTVRTALDPKDAMRIAREIMHAAYMLGYQDDRKKDESQ